KDVRKEDCLILNYRLKPEDDEDDDFDYEDEHVELESEKDEYDNEDDDEELEQPQTSPLKPARHEGSSERPLGGQEPGLGAGSENDADKAPPAPKKRAPRKPPQKVAEAGTPAYSEPVAA